MAKEFSWTSHQHLQGPEGWFSVYHDQAEALPPTALNTKAPTNVLPSPNRLNLLPEHRRTVNDNRKQTWQSGKCLYDMIK